MPRGTLREGEPLLLVDRRGRRYMIVLKPGGASDIRGGKVAHDDLLGREEGGTIRSTRGERFLAVRPTLAEFILEMPRGAQVVYPKDLGPILMMADVFPGARVLEAGTGSGALTMTLLRAVGAAGRVVSYEIREDFARIADRNIRRYLGAADALVLRQHDVYEGVLPEDRPLDRIVLDVPEPWRAVPHAVEAVEPGGILVAYVPTVPQAAQATEALRASGAFTLVDTVEILVRPWNIDGRSVRPVHRMVAHTGFLVSARRVRPQDTKAPSRPADPPGDAGEDANGADGGALT